MYQVAMDNQPGHLIGRCISLQIHQLQLVILRLETINIHPVCHQVVIELIPFQLATGFLHQ